VKLYGYARSSASFRVRIALHLKGIRFEIEPVDLLAGEQRRETFLAINPQGLVPVLDDDGIRIAQSLAAVEYLEERFPDPPLLPPDAPGRARVRQLALLVACEIHPLQNVGVLRDLECDFAADASAREAWARRVIDRGLVAFERQLAARRPPGPFCHGERPGLADLCLVPQLFNARKFHCDLGRCTVLREIEAACLEHDAFLRALPEELAQMRPTNLGGSR
jgi:maleylacetoacetate isomerase